MSRSNGHDHDHVEGPSCRSDPLTQVPSEGRGRPLETSTEILPSWVPSQKACTVYRKKWYGRAVAGSADLYTAPSSSSSSRAESVPLDVEAVVRQGQSGLPAYHLIWPFLLLLAGPQPCMKAHLISWAGTVPTVQKPQSADTCLGIEDAVRVWARFSDPPCPMTMTQPSAVPLGRPGTAASYQLRCDAMRCDRAGPATSP